MSFNVILEDMISDLGGCGRYQIFTTVVGQAGNALASWSMLAMSFNGQEPDFMCKTDDRNVSETNYTIRAPAFDNLCKAGNSSTDCQEFVYGDNMHTIVDEWNLVCDSKWIVAMVTTIQMAGVLVGCFVAGHLGDLVGRKPIFYISVVMLILFNTVGIFSVNWQMYAAVRFMIGVGAGWFLTVSMNLMTEFVLTKWRAGVVAIPSWAIVTSLFALAAWGLRDWKYLHIATAAIGVPFLFTICTVQESTRWLLTKKRYEDAQRVLEKVAKINRQPVPDTTTLIEATKAYNAREESKTKHSVLDLFKSRELTKITLGLVFIWMSSSYAYYGITFGIRSLSGDLYLNMFLMNIIEAPASMSVMFFVDKFGRKYCCMFFFMLTGICGLVVGVVQYLDTPNQGAVINGFAYVSKIGMTCGWGSIIVYTTELYPTVVRSIGYGLSNTAARVGGMVAPQIVFLNESVPGVMYFLSGALYVICSLLCFVFPETKGKPLEDGLVEKDGGKQTKQSGNTTESDSNIECIKIQPLNEYQ